MGTALLHRLLHESCNTAGTAEKFIMFQTDVWFWKATRMPTKA
jgi:hypothetical protein